MSKGDIFEPIIELAFEFTARIFFPRHGSNSILDELSWSWFAALILIGIAQISIKSLASAMTTHQSEGLSRDFRKRLTLARWALWGALFLSLFMFRFASAF